MHFSCSRDVRKVLEKLWCMLSNENNGDIAFWHRNGTTFVIADISRFRSELCPLLFPECTFAYFLYFLKACGFFVMAELGYEAWHNHFLRNKFTGIRSIKVINNLLPPTNFISLSEDEMIKRLKIPLSSVSIAEEQVCEQPPVPTQSSASHQPNSATEVPHAAQFQQNCIVSLEQSIQTSNVPGQTIVNLQDTQATTQPIMYTQEFPPNLDQFGQTTNHTTSYPSTQLAGVLVQSHSQNFPNSRQNGNAAQIQVQPQISNSASQIQVLRPTGTISLQISYPQRESMDFPVPQEFDIALFYERLWILLNDERNRLILQWTPDGKKFLIFNIERMQLEICPLFFELCTWANFLQTLYACRFRRHRHFLEFSHEVFTQRRLHALTREERHELFRTELGYKASALTDRGTLDSWEDWLGPELYRHTITNAAGNAQVSIVAPGPSNIAARSDTVPPPRTRKNSEPKKYLDEEGAVVDVVSSEDSNGDLPRSTPSTRPGSPSDAFSARSSERNQTSDEESTRASERNPTSDEESTRASEQNPTSDEESTRASEQNPTSDEESTRASEQNPSSDEESTRADNQTNDESENNEDEETTGQESTQDEGQEQEESSNSGDESSGDGSNDSDGEEMQGTPNASSNNDGDDRSDDDGTVDDSSSSSSDEDDSDRGGEDDEAPLAAAKKSPVRTRRPRKPVTPSKCARRNLTDGPSTSAATQEPGSASREENEETADETGETTGEEERPPIIVRIPLKYIRKYKKRRKQE